MARAALRWEISRLRVSSMRFPSAPYRHAAPLEMTVAAGTIGHACGVRVHWTHLRCEDLKGSKGGRLSSRAMSFIIRLRRSRQHRVSILSAYLVHPFPLRGTSPQGETRALRDWPSVSYGMISTLVIGSLRSPPKGETAEWYMKYMTLCFSSPYFSFPLEGNASKRQRVYKAERR